MDTFGTIWTCLRAKWNGDKNANLTSLEEHVDTFMIPLQSVPNEALLAYWGRDWVICENKRSNLSSLHYSFWAHRVDRIFLLALLPISYLPCAYRSKASRCELLEQSSRVGAWVELALSIEFAHDKATGISIPRRYKRILHETVP